MMNYGIFTRIYVLQGFNAKEVKRVEKAAKWLKQENGKYSGIILHCHDKTPRELAEVCRNKPNCVAIRTK